MDLGDRAEEEGGHGCSSADYPNQDRQKHPGGVFRCAEIRQRMDHSQVSVDGHDGQEENAAVKPSEEDKSHNFADNFRKHPSLDVVNGPERKTDGEDEVRDGQVEDENVGQRFKIFIQSQDYEDKNVSCQAQCDHNREENRNGKGSKCHHSTLITDFILVVIVISAV